MIIEKLKQLLLSRGFVGLIRFILSRIVRSTHENIYQKNYDAKQQKIEITPLEPTWNIQRIDRHNFLEESKRVLLNSLCRGEVTTYINAIKADSILFAVTEGEKVIHTSFIQFKSRYKNLIQELNETPLIGNCWTDNQYRGNGLYPKTIYLAAESLFESGYERVLISCATDNIASIKGIEKANFDLVQELKSYIFLNKFAFQLSKKDKQHNWKFIIF